MNMKPAPNDPNHAKLLEYFELLTNQHFEEAFKIIENFDLCEGGERFFYMWYEKQIACLEDYAELGNFCVASRLTIFHCLHLAFLLIYCDKY